MTAWPIVYSTTAVSPTARPIASTMPVMMRGVAAGSTILLTVCHLVAPSPYDPQRMYLGTDRIASSVARMMIGSMRSESASAAEIIESPSPIASTKSAKPNNPITIDGTLASESAAKRIVETVLPW